MLVERPGCPQSLDEPEALDMYTFEGYMFFYLKDGQMENDENYPERFETILDSWFSDSNFQVYQITWTTTNVICYEKHGP